MEIRTKAIFYDENKEKYETDYIFSLFSVIDATSTKEGYTIITVDSVGNNIEIKIKFETWWKTVQKYNLNTLRIIE